MDDQTSMVDYLYNTSRFFAHESCGQCTPCREGTSWMYKTFKRIKAGGGRLEDLDVLGQMADNMGLTPGTTICGLADGAAWPIKNVLAKFRPELEEYIRTHQAPRPLVTPLQKAIAAGRLGRPDQHAAPDRPQPLGRPAVAPRVLSRVESSRSPRAGRAESEALEGTPMATIIINGQDHTLPEGEKLNAIQAAKLAGVDIPYYCWHPALSVVANCRMCEIEVGTEGRRRPARSR